VPTEPPVVELISMAGRVGKFRVHSGTSPTKRGKPRGCVGANICTYVGQVAPTDADQYQFQGLATRSIVQVQFPLSVPNGSTVRLSACWVTARGVKSFYSSPIVFTIQGGETLPGDSVAA
jgi:heterodisulfide reductase subunit A-like polyferredoxin